MGRSGHELLDRLIDEVARGERDLSSIRNPEMRESVRVALRLHADAPSVADAYTKARMRARVMARLDPRGRTLRDNAWTILELLARPAPFIVRGVATSAFGVIVALAGFAASADALPDDLLYPLKISAEHARLTLAAAPADRAAVELSIAEHRLAEAEKLAASGRTSDALVASAFYSQHIASAAAELGPLTDGDLGAQLEMRFSAQRERASSLAASLAMNVTSERAAQVLAMIATSPLAPGSTRVERVAESAVTLAADLADAAESAVETDASDESSVAAESIVVATPATAAAQAVDAFLERSATRTATAPRATDRVAAADRLTVRSTEITRASTRPSLRPATTPDPRASDAAKAARAAAEKAKAAAEKLKVALKKGNSGRR